MYTQCEQILKDFRMGKDVTDAAAQLEPALKQYYKKRRKIIQENTDYGLAYDFLLHPQDALYDISPTVKNYWDTIYPLMQSQNGKYSALLRFVDAREKYLGASHTDSVRILFAAGWTPADVMAAYLENRHGFNTLTLSPDAAAEAAKADMDTALRLLARKKTSLFENSYSMFQQFEWIDFMYLFLGYQDFTFLNTPHKSKRLCQYCQKVLDRLSQGPAKQTVSAAQADLPDFSVFEGATLTQRHTLSSAAGQRLRKGNDNNGYYVLSYHLVDEEQGNGAALRFDGLYKAPEYYDTHCPSWGVYFYRFPYFLPFDHIPESWRCAPGELPEDFVRKAYRAFSKLCGFESK